MLLRIASEHDISITFHLEPYENRSALSTAENIQYIVEKYGDHPAFYRTPDTNRPLFFVYDHYLIKSTDWAKVLKSNGANSIRGYDF